jgi:hypothetical protein
MRTLVIVLTMALITLTFTALLIVPTLAQAPALNVPDVRGLVQPPSLMPSGPRTVPLMGKDGQQIGTATFSGNRIFLRNPQNEIFAQIVVDADGARTMYDAHGKVLDRIEAEKK